MICILKGKEMNKSAPTTCCRAVSYAFQMLQLYTYHATFQDYLKQVNASHQDHLDV